jgi:glycosyltransferase involved in cell wall biosynthesis
MRLTIITVIRDEIEGLQRTMQSLQDQLEADVEWLIIDGSLSQPVDIHTLEVSSVGMIRVLRRKPFGIYDAMNYGIAHARGEWCWFLNAGDIFVQEDSVHQGLKMIQVCSDDSLIATSVLYLSGQGYLFNSVDPSGKFKCDTQAINIHHQGAILRTSTLSELGGFRTDLRVTADGELMDRICANYKISSFSHPLVGFYMGGMSTRNFGFALRETNTFRKDFYPKRSIWRLRVKNIGLRTLLFIERFKPFGRLVEPYLSRRATRVRSRLLHSGENIRIRY